MPFGIGLAAILMTALALGQTGERPASAALIGSVRVPGRGGNSVSR